MERTNQVHEQYLWCYLKFKQDNWAPLLTFTEFAYNNSMNAAAGQMPLFANYGFHPQLHPALPTTSKNPSAMARVHYESDKGLPQPDEASSLAKLESYRLFSIKLWQVTTSAGNCSPQGGQEEGQPGHNTGIGIIGALSRKLNPGPTRAHE